MVYMFMMPSMISGPSECGSFKGGCPEEEGINFNKWVGLECEVREESVVSKGDAHCCGDEEKEEEEGLKC